MKCKIKGRTSVVKMQFLKQAYVPAITICVNLQKTIFNNLELTSTTNLGSGGVACAGLANNYTVSSITSNGNGLLVGGTATVMVINNGNILILDDGNQLILDDGNIFVLE